MFEFSHALLFFFIFEFRFEVPRLFPRSCLVAHCTLPLVCEHVGKQKKRENKNEWNSGRFLVCDFGFGCTPVEGFFFLLPFCLVGFWRSAVGYLILVCICTLLVFMLIDCMYIFCDFFSLRLILRGISYTFYAVARWPGFWITHSVILVRIASHHIASGQRAPLQIPDLLLQLEILPNRTILAPSLY